MRYDPSEAEGVVADPARDRGRGEFYIAAWRRAFDFRGVASRTEYWSFVLPNSTIVLCLLLGIWVEEGAIAWVFGYAILVILALTAVPYLSVSIRRFRDVTGTGWFALLIPLQCTPFLGSVIGTLMGASRGEQIDTSANYIGVWRKTPDWLSRSDRTEFWMFILFNTLIYLGSSIVLAILGVLVDTVDSTYGATLVSLILVLVLVLFAPLLPLLVRRVRDATGSGWVTPFLLPAWFVNPFLFFVIIVWPSRDAERLGGLSGGYWDVWRKTADYVGVARRNEFWPFTLINSAVLIGGAVLVGGLYFSQRDSFGNLSPVGLILVPVILWPLVASYFAWSIPWFSLAVRRVRDATGSGWWLLTCLVPVIGWMAALVLFLLPTRKATSSSPSGPSEEQIPSMDEGARYEADDPWSTQRPGTTGQ